MVFRFTADKPGTISFTASLDRLAELRDRRRWVGRAADDRSAPAQRAAGVEGMKFVARLRAMHSGGKVSVDGDTLHVDSADEVVLLVAAATNYQGFAGRRTADPLKATARRHRQGRRPSRTSSCAPPTSPTTAATSTA